MLNSGHSFKTKEFERGSRFVSSTLPIAALAAVALMLMPLATRAGIIDATAAQALARHEHCLKCHGIDKKKNGPAFSQVAAKYHGQPDAEERLLLHVRAGEIVTLANGDEEQHRVVKTRDEEQIRNLIRWILSL